MLLEEGKVKAFSVLKSDQNRIEIERGLNMEAGCGYVLKSDQNGIEIYSW